MQTSSVNLSPCTVYWRGRVHQFMRHYYRAYVTKQCFSLFGFICFSFFKFLIGLRCMYCQLKYDDAWGVERAYTCRTVHYLSVCRRNSVMLVRSVDVVLWKYTKQQLRVFWINFTSYNRRVSSIEVNLIYLLFIFPNLWFCSKKFQTAKTIC